MAYKNIKPIILSFEELSSQCLLFYWSNKDEDDSNYCCKSKSKEKDDGNRCSSWNCPLCCEADLQSLKDCGEIELYNQFKKDFTEEQLKTEQDCLVEDYVMKFCEI